ncbi:YopX family protein [Staphylococcus gallinarum]|uniref:YopX family protein n=1 Tax=Staphylococcus gallinarum TaxID=1293 RepID=UPI0024424885|nr:YopX family protein [Staphylococcus gallinarum]
MRKIKFRVFDKESCTSPMHIVGEDQHDELTTTYDGKVNYYNLQNGEGSGTPYSDYILMQFTGLTDINGKDIYEDDIVREVYASINGVKSYRNKIVKWREFHAGFNIENIDLEIIGNIHENPELIPAEKLSTPLEGDE